MGDDRPRCGRRLAEDLEIEMANVPDMPADGWFIARNREQDGPFTAKRLRQMARQGWLTPDDLVWHPMLPAWTPARAIDGLFGTSWSRLLGAVIPGLRAPAARAAVSASPTTPDAPRRRSSRRRRPRRGAKANAAGIAWPEVRPRHLIAVAGVLLASLGVAFFTIAASPLARGLLIGGIVTTGAAFMPEITRLAIRGARLLERMRHEGIERRIREQEWTSERQQAEEEARLRLAEQQRVAASWATPPQAERVMVVREPRVKRWNRWVAALLSAAIPGRGQGYKGEVAAGIAWCVIVVAAYTVVTTLGVVLHACCCIGAATGDPWTEERTSVVRV
jgi:hypothetical protein